MSVPVVIMMDTTHNSVGNIPDGVSVVGGYTTGTPDIEWTDADWAKFPHAVKSRIEQGHGNIGAPNTYNEIDVEAGAIAPSTAATMVAARVMAGYEWTTIYASRANLRLVADAVKAYGDNIWIGHVNCRLADWSLNETEAAALVGTIVEGMTCIGVQWASPSSNPHTSVPGGVGTLSSSNIDLSVVAAGWEPSILSIPAPPQPPVEPTETNGYVVYAVGNNIVGHAVTSTDLHTWQ